MPNWCYNSVVVSAKTATELEEFIKFAKQTHHAHELTPFTDERVEHPDSQGVFWNFITPPEEIREEYFGRQPQYSDSLSTSDPNWWAQVEERRKVSTHWYDWNITNWGTKWDVSWEEEDVPSIEQQNDSRFFLVWHFNTAWGAPEPVYRAMAERFPNIEFDFEATEESNAFAGKMTFVDGKVVTDEWVSQPTHEDYDRLDIPCIGCGSEYDESCWGHKEAKEAQV
jgi:hypothetical protein